MRFFSPATAFLICALLLALALVPARGASLPVEAASKLLPERLGDFRAKGAVETPALTEELNGIEPGDYQAAAAAARTYVGSGQTALRVLLVTTRTDTGAYALLTSLRPADKRAETPAGIGTQALAAGNRLAFFKGPVFVLLEGARENPASGETLAAAAKSLAENLDAGEGEVPVLVKHLPGWEAVEARAVYALARPALEKAAGSDAPIFEAVDFTGGTEAVVAPYQASARLVILEHATPQAAAENDASVKTRVEQLRAAGGPVPSAYRRVGNYLVFVLGEPDETAAKQLLEGVRYEQVVRWLGDNPRAYEMAEKLYAQTTAGVIVAALKATGASLLLCLGIGALFGGFIFMRRRTQQSTSAIYTDAGGMVRLNIDELTGPDEEVTKLLGEGGTRKD